MVYSQEREDDVTMPATKAIPGPPFDGFGLLKTPSFVKVNEKTL